MNIDIIPSPKISKYAMISTYALHTAQHKKKKCYGSVVLYVVVKLKTVIQTKPPKGQK